MGNPKMYIDYAGKTLQIVDKQSGAITDVQFFVAVLGASQPTYAEATLTQKKEDFFLFERAHNVLFSNVKN